MLAGGFIKCPRENQIVGGSITKSVRTPACRRFFEWLYTQICLQIVLCRTSSEMILIGCLIQHEPFSIDLCVNFADDSRGNSVHVRLYEAIHWYYLILCWEALRTIGSFKSWISGFLNSRVPDFERNKHTFRLMEIQKSWFLHFQNSRSPEFQSSRIIEVRMIEFQNPRTSEFQIIEFHNSLICAETQRWLFSH